MNVSKVPINAILGREITPTQEASFWSMVKVNWVSGCWEWTSTNTTGMGYGRFKLGNKKASANRVAYAIAYGYVPNDKFVCHKCDNPSCVNPAHLFLGSPAENAADRVSKSRQAKGAKAGGAILDDDKVRLILNDERTHLEIAKEYGVAKSTIGKIKSGVNWKHVTTLTTT